MSLYHYTDLNAIFSILNRPVLWCTDLRYLNDRTEFRHGLERLLANMPHAPHGLFYNFETVTESRAYVESALLQAESQYANYNDIFVASLSRSGDLLSQWRGYGQYAIEFHEEELQRQVPGLHQCLYSLPEQNAAALSALTDAISVASYDLQPNGLVGIKGLDAVSKLQNVAATFKDDGFAEEREVRIIITEVSAREVKFRPRGQILIPYVEVPITLDCIKAIHIGPIAEQENALKSMADFCQQIQEGWQEESANIEYWLQVTTSTIPFRAR